MVEHAPDWSPELIAKTEAILQQAEAQKPKWIRAVDRALYWTLLLLAVVGNFVVSVALVPIFVAIEGWALYFILFFIGASFGWLFSFILIVMEKWQPKQHIIASIFIPSIALINVAIMAALSNKLIGALELATLPHNPALVGGGYVLGYVLPYAVLHVRTKKI